jgi:Na+/phosphate symporter
MLVNRYKQLAAAGLSVSINVVIGGLLSYCMRTYILANIKSIPLAERNGYRNTLINCIGEVLFFLLCTSIVYYLIISLIPAKAKLTVKMGVAAFVGGVVFFGFHAISMSFDFDNFGEVSELIIISVTAANVPFLESRMSRSLIKKYT